MSSSPPAALSGRERIQIREELFDGFRHAVPQDRLVARRVHLPKVLLGSEAHKRATTYQDHVGRPFLVKVWFELKLHEDQAMLLACGIPKVAANMTRRMRAEAIEFSCSTGHEAEGRMANRGHAAPHAGACSASPRPGTSSPSMRPRGTGHGGQGRLGPQPPILRRSAFNPLASLTTGCGSLHLPIHARIRRCTLGMS